MKFLSKNSESEILKKKIVYKKNADNQHLLNLLIEEQHNFCAYTDKFFENLESIDVEHFNSSLKETEKDDYFNYYAVLHKSNLYKIKKDKKYKDVSFFETLFFQNKVDLDSRIQYVKGGFYEEVDLDDIEAKEFIDFLGLNDSRLYRDRIVHLGMLKDIISNANFSKEQMLSFFKRNKKLLDFVTAIEVELEIDLEEVIKS
ncbi:MAG: hypothetical protein ACK479_10835 [Fluviicola sp.]